MRREPNEKGPPGPRMIRVIVRETPTGAVIHDKVGDFNERYFRDWIDGTQWWAMRNYKYMSFEPAA